MVLKLASLAFSIILGAMYCIGFIYDSAFLEEFGVNYYELLASPMDYLSIGGVHLLTLYSKNISFLFFGLGTLAVFYVPIKRRIQRAHVEKFIDIESTPYILLSMLPLAFIFLIPVIPVAKEDAKEIFETGFNDLLCVEDVTPCEKGVILRYRDSKIVFYNSETKKASVYTDKRLIKAEHGR